MAQNEGKRFEQDLMKSLPPGAYHYRLPDPGWQGDHAWGGPDSKRFTVSNPFDFFVFHEGRLYCLECKSTGSSSWPYSLRDKHLKGLQRAARYSRVLAGVVINFRVTKQRKEARTFYLGIGSLLHVLKIHNDRKSVTVAMAEEAGIELPGHLIQVRYRWDLTPLIGSAAEQRPFYTGVEDQDE